MHNLCACVHVYMHHHHVCSCIWVHQPLKTCVEAKVSIRYLPLLLYTTFLRSVLNLELLANELLRSAIYTTTNPNDEFIGICCCIYLLYNFYMSARDLYSGFHAYKASSSLIESFPQSCLCFHTTVNDRLIQLVAIDKKLSFHTPKSFQTKLQELKLIMELKT